jgi:argininosuccinate lyase
LGVPLSKMDPKEFQAIHPGFEKDLADAFRVESAVLRRSAKGGTAPQAVKEQIIQAKKILEKG